MIVWQYNIKFTLKTGLIFCIYQLIAVYRNKYSDYSFSRILSKKFLYLHLVRSLEGKISIYKFEARKKKQTSYYALQKYHPVYLTIQLRQLIKNTVPLKLFLEKGSPIRFHRIQTSIDEKYTRCT